MFIVVAGGIGSGKSAVSDIIESEGYVVIRADDINRELLLNGEYLRRLINKFPEAFENGVLDRRKLRNIIFESEPRRAELNAMAHPIILRELKSRASRYPLAFAEIPLAGESLDESYYDMLCVVTAPVDVRIKRIIARDGVTEEEAAAAISAQSAEALLTERADYIIENDGSLAELSQKVKEFIKYVR